MAFNLDQYEEVKDRLPRFLKDHPEGRVITELMSPVSELATVVFKAFLYVGDTLVSTGFSFEKENSGPVNRTSHLENCETSAIGRALANYGYSGSKRPSREEMEKVQRAEEEIKRQEQIKADFEMKKEAIRKWVVTDQAGIMGYLIDQGLDPKVEENIPVIYNQLSSLKKQYMVPK